jgi:hypothetical protein
MQSNCLADDRLYDRRKRGDLRKAEDLVHEIVDTAIDMEGTCTGGTPELSWMLI